MFYLKAFYRTINKLPHIHTYMYIIQCDLGLIFRRALHVVHRTLYSWPPAYMNYRKRMQLGVRLMHESTKVTNCFLQ